MKTTLHDTPQDTIDRIDGFIEELERNAELPKDETKRLRDAPGWSLKVARHLQKRKSRLLKAVKHKENQRRKTPRQLAKEQSNNESNYASSE